MLQWMLHYHTLYIQSMLDHLLKLAYFYLLRHDFTSINKRCVCDVGGGTKRESCICKYGAPHITCKKKKLNRAHDLLVSFLDLLKRVHDLLFRSLDLLKHAHDLLFHSLDLLKHAYNLLFRTLNL